VSGIVSNSGSTLRARDAGVGAAPVSEERSYLARLGLSAPSHVRSRHRRTQCGFALVSMKTKPPFQVHAAMYLVCAHAATARLAAYRTLQTSDRGGATSLDLDFLSAHGLRDRTLPVLLLFG
jgi:hypothetical protein